MKRLLACALVAFGFVALSEACFTFAGAEEAHRIFYVDYASGSDSADGLSPATAWKHSPGDAEAAGSPKAAGNPKNILMKPGDKVLFKGGVVYHGTINIRFSGGPGEPIVFEGLGWGEGKAMLSGMAQATVDFAPYHDRPGVSVATTPPGLRPGPENLVKIDGRIAWMANNSTSADPGFPDNGQTSFDAFEISGPDKSWILRNATLGKLLAPLTMSETSNVILHVYGIPNVQYTMTVAGYDRDTNAVSLNGHYVKPQPHKTSFTLYNSPLLVSPTNPYPQYAIEGDQLIAAVSPGTHELAVSAHKWGVSIGGGASNLVIDGFDFSGYGSGDGRAIIAGAGENIKITNNTISNLMINKGFGYPGIYTLKNSHIVIADNTVGPNTNGAGISVLASTDAVVTRNTIVSPSWTSIIAFNDVDTFISENRIFNSQGVHACGVIAFDTPDVQNGKAPKSQNVNILNNLFRNDANLAEDDPRGGCGVAVEGYTLPSNFTVAYNVFTGSTPDFAVWAGLQGLNIHGNIMLAIHPGDDSIRTSTTTPDLTYRNNIVSQFQWRKQPLPAENHVIFSNNVAIGSPKNIPEGGNSYNPALEPILKRALATPGPLPASICQILNPDGQPVKIGVDWRCE